MYITEHNLLIKQRLHVATSLLERARGEQQGAQQTLLLQSVCLALWQTLQCVLARSQSGYNQNAPWQLDVGNWYSHNQEHAHAHLFAQPWVAQFDALYKQLYQTQEAPTTQLATTALRLTPQCLDNIVQSVQNCIHQIMEHHYEC